MFFPLKEILFPAGVSIANLVGSRFVVRERLSGGMETDSITLFPEHGVVRLAIRPVPSVRDPSPPTTVRWVSWTGCIATPAEDSDARIRGANPAQGSLPLVEAPAPVKSETPANAPVIIPTKKAEFVPPLEVVEVETPKKPGKPAERK
jgi:hypothetical protein